MTLIKPVGTHTFYQPKAARRISASPNTFPRLLERDYKFKVNDD
jgi:hypothetical protein